MTGVSQSIVPALTDVGDFPDIPVADADEGSSNVPLLEMQCLMIKLTAPKQHV